MLRRKSGVNINTPDVQNLWPSPQTPSFFPKLFSLFERNFTWIFEPNGDTSDIDGDTGEIYEVNIRTTTFFERIRVLNFDRVFIILSNYND